MPVTFFQRLHQIWDVVICSNEFQIIYSTLSADLERSLQTLQRNRYLLSLSGKMLSEKNSYARAFMLF